MTMAVIAMSTLLFFTACNSIAGNSKKETTELTHTEASLNDGHTFACPMHSEVTGKEGDECPKCGMKLVHNDKAGTASHVSMLFSTNPAAVVPGQEVTLSLTPKIKDKPNEQVPLDVAHTKKIHLIVVNDDLSWFDHIHPEFNTDGSYTVKEKFPTPGKYTLFADFKPSGGNPVVDNLTVTVAGKLPAPENYGTDKLTCNAGDGFSVSLMPEGGQFLTNTAMHINGVVMLNGKEADATVLEDYLGAKAHMVVVSLADKKYLHVHPNVEGAKFDLHTTFDKSGVYRGWIQFQSKGKVYTSDFAMNVAEGKTGDMKTDEQKGH
jgi:hypothetical protein